MTDRNPISQERIDECWKEARDLWGVQVALSPPAAAEEDRRHRAGEDPLAFIDLETRQVVVNLARLHAIGAQGSLTAVLAHELGHHVRFPHTLGLVAELQSLEKKLIPLLSQSLTNIFFDLQVNEVVGRTLCEELCAVYKGSLQKKPGEIPPLFLFYMAVYEELWGLDPGTLFPSSETEATMEQLYPGFRGDARMFAQTFFSEEDVYLQFLYFCGRFIRYLPDPSKLDFLFALTQDIPKPTDDDYDRGAFGNDQIDRAIEEAVKRGWISEKEKARALDEEGMDGVKQVTHHSPGTARIGFRKSPVGDSYRKLVDRYLIEPPPVSLPPEPSIPTVTEEWQPGDGLRSIDWTASILSAGALAPIRPLRRELFPDEPAMLATGLPAMEIYLDTSGSMPDPKTQINAMTLAALVLSASVIRKGGVVRGIVYSCDWILSDWMYSEEVAREFFLHYSGGGTQFPFPVLRKLSRERRDVIRVVISDSDFLYNVSALWRVEPATDTAKRAYRGPRSVSALEYGVRRSRLFVVMLALPGSSDAYLKSSLGPVLRYPQLRLAIVNSVDNLAAAAAKLAKAILG